jgi:mRNA-degrading endonuclease YafQ of YafQ-DinJ toxin-antitoxin module
LRSRVDRILRDLAVDPHQPHLQLHQLHGSLEGFQAVRVDYDNRIVLTIQVSEREITLHDIGSHDEVYR